MSGFDDEIIDEFRSNNGHVSAHGFGDSLVLVHHVGVRTGEAHVSPLMGLPDDGGWLITASAAGAPRHPAWYHNLLARPETRIEVPGESGVTTVPVVVEDLRGSDRDEAWGRFVQRSPSFARYEQKAGDRVIPVLRLTPAGRAT
jgi:deazaflavin-dependent oxidoreductase (nitroreductase family)